MSQTSYAVAPSAAFAGQLADVGYSRVGSYVNANASPLPAGIGAYHSATDACDLPGTSTNKLAGIVLNSFARDPNNLVGATDAVPSGATADILEEGAAWVVVEVAVNIGDPVFVRYASGAGGTQKGAFRKDADTATARAVKGATWLSTTSGAGIAKVYFSRSADNTQF